MQSKMNAQVLAKLLAKPPPATYSDYTNSALDRWLEGKQSPHHFFCAIVMTWRTFGSGPPGAPGRLLKYANSAARSLSSRRA
jgi:hypothetical protein